MHKRLTMAGIPRKEVTLELLLVNPANLLRDRHDARVFIIDACETENDDGHLAVLRLDHLLRFELRARSSPRPAPSARIR